VPVPCDGYYCRPLLALSVALSPLWLCYYFHDQFDFVIFDQPLGVILATFGVPLLIGLVVLRFAPRGDLPPRPLAAVPLTLLGFVVSATWLDLVADKLVNLMTFFGIICRIPSTIMGLTVLAWGNSSQDLIANMTVARKDLSTMAITASFAGPVFNILVGLGLGFALLYSKKPDKTIHVKLDNPLRVGFLFSVLNGVLMIVSGICVGKGSIPKKYGYAAMVVYSVYVVVSITV
jgi:sodium/potassium/calcium exchanger 6